MMAYPSSRTLQSSKSYTWNFIFFPLCTTLSQYTNPSRLSPVFPWFVHSFLFHSTPTFLNSRLDSCNHFLACSAWDLSILPIDDRWPAGTHCSICFSKNHSACLPMGPNLKPSRKCLLLIYPESPLSYSSKESFPSRKCNPICLMFLTC